MDTAADKILLQAVSQGSARGNMGHVQFIKCLSEAFRPDNVSPTSGSFRCKERDVGDFTDLGRRGLREKCRQADADACRDFDCSRVDFKRLGYIGDDRTGKLGQPRRVGQRGADDDEFVSPGTDQKIVFAGMSAHDARHPFEHGVTTRMTKRVVDLLEQIKIDVKDRVVGS